MQPAYPPVSRPSSSSSPEGRGTNQGAHEGGALPGTWLYKVPRERGLGWYLAGSIVLFTVLTSLASLLPPEEKLPPMIEVDLGTDAIENEPPPLGEIDAGASEPAEAPVAEPMPEEETQPPEPEPEPEPPEPEPSVEEPVPPPAPEFVAPKEELPPPKPRPKPVAKIPPKVVRKPAPIQVAGPATAPPSAPAGSGLSTGRIGVRGSPGGKPGGKGGGRGDFISTP
ncbi:MAG: hypothetical protein V4710_14405, partial [Verrucomicrobiota bacterium]